MYCTDCDNIGDLSGRITVAANNVRLQDCLDRQSWVRSSGSDTRYVLIILFITIVENSTRSGSLSRQEHAAILIFYHEFSM